MLETPFFLTFIPLLGRRIPRRDGLGPQDLFLPENALSPHVLFIDRRQKPPSFSLEEVPTNGVGETKESSPFGNSVHDTPPPSGRRGRPNSAHSMQLSLFPLPPQVRALFFLRILAEVLFAEECTPFPHGRRRLSPLFFYQQIEVFPSPLDRVLNIELSSPPPKKGPPRKLKGESIFGFRPG